MAKSVVLLALLLPLVHADSLTTHTGSLTTHIGSLITHADSLAACSMHTFNNSGCTTAGNYASLPNVPTAAACCAACASNATGCFGWTFHAALKAKGRSCNLASNPRLQVGVQGATCGCRNTGCAAPAPPPPPPVPCVPVKRPPAPAPSMLPVGKRPHILTVLVDDLGWDDTAIHNDALTELTPTIAALKKEGVVLMRHHTYLWCSPTRRAFLSGRFPVHISGIQAPTESNYLPLQFTILSEKLAAAEYESHFIGKHHLGAHTMDHLMANRVKGFKSNTGYIGGGESYDHGCVYGQTGNCTNHDMWCTLKPCSRELLYDADGGDVYSTDFYTRTGLSELKNRDKSKPFWLHMAYQAVHAPYTSPPADQLIPESNPFRSRIYGSMLKVMDAGVANITAEYKRQGMWSNTLLILMGDNGGDCGLPDQPGVKGQPGMASNYPLLGRKCTAFEGGTRVAAVVAGGLLPPARHGTLNHQLMYVTDWYSTLCKLSGVSPSDPWKDGAGVVRDVDSVDLWPTISQGEAVAQVSRAWLPSSERSILWSDAKNKKMWKLITAGNSWLQSGKPYGRGEFMANRFDKNGTQYMDGGAGPTTSNLRCIGNSSALGEAELRRAENSATLPWFGGGAAPAGGLNSGEGVPPSCIVCTNSTPCLFEVLSDPSEFKNLNAMNKTDLSVPAGLIATMLAKLGTYAVYSPLLLTAPQLACYNCSHGPHERWSGAAQWGGFVGPTCLPKK